MAGGAFPSLPPRATAQDASDIAEFTRRWLNLADARMDATVVGVTDDAYGSASRLLNPKPASLYPHDEDGMRWVDGWETRRRRAEGHEHCIIRLGQPGRVTGVVFDTSYFTGNPPVGVSLEACSCAGAPGPQASWTELVGFAPLAGNAQLLARVQDERSWTHVRLHMYPDGGMARLRVFGAPCPDWGALAGGGVADLAALRNGGRVVGCNDSHFNDVRGLIAPGPSIAWGKGWETRRRREPGHDWAVLALGRAGRIRRVEIDTTYYTGNFPERFSLQAACLPETPDVVVLNQAMFWPVLLSERTLEGASSQVIETGIADLGPVTHVRLNIFPDGGVTRLRLFGEPVKEGDQA